jgi:hypothetical protein
MNLDPESMKIILTRVTTIFDKAQYKDKQHMHMVFKMSHHMALGAPLAYQRGGSQRFLSFPINSPNT